MGATKSTLVANAYHEAITVCVTEDIVEVSDDITENVGFDTSANVHAKAEVKVKANEYTDASAGASAKVAPGFTYKDVKKLEYKAVGPGLVTIAAGTFYSFAEHGRDGKVFVTIKAGEVTLHKNVEVKNGCGVIVGSKGGLHNVQHGESWVDEEAIHDYHLLTKH